MNSTDYFQEFLATELARRCERNPRYSTRAFAKALDVDAGSLSRILSGKQIPSHKVCETIFSKLELTPTAQKKFLKSVAAKQKALGFKRISPAFKELGESADDRRLLDTDIWRTIADWYHGAIMELTFVDGFQSEPKWIAQQLGVSEAEIKMALTRLKRLGLLRVEDGKYIKTVAQVSSGDKSSTTAAHRRLQRQVLTKAVDSLENDPLDVRNMTSMTMAIDPRKVPEAKKMIQNFSRELCAYLESGKRTQVYQLGVCLYPISKKQEEK
ncbi:MAG: DUF4423 domain-containing protein [Bdellovibrionales bacterium]|nr:DUF4423 domain-containing protein [Bdellovibrionales bacterium]